MTELTVEKAAVAVAQDEVGLIAPTYPLPRLELVKGRGARVWDKDGVERLDFVSGIAVNFTAPTTAGSTVSRSRGRVSRQTAGSNTFVATHDQFDWET